MFNIRKRLYDEPASGAWKTNSEVFRKAGKAVIEVEVRAAVLLKDTDHDAALAKWNGLIVSRKIDPQETGPFKTYDHKKQWSGLSYETDHQKSLGKYWNEGENNKDDATRATTTLDQANWKVLTRRENREKSGEEFKREVGENFSSVAANSPQGATMIGGILFMDTPP